MSPTWFESFQKFQSFQPFRSETRWNAWNELERLERLNRQRLRASSRSCSPSPTKLSASTVSMMASPDRW